MKRTGIVHVGRTGAEALEVLAEEIGFSDPDKLMTTSPNRWPQKRQARRGCITLDKQGAKLLGMGWVTPYVKVDLRILVELPGAEHGLFRVQRIQDLHGLRPEGGAHLFLEEILAPDPHNRADQEGSVVLGDDPDARARLEQQTEEIKAETAQIEANADLGTLEDLL